MALNAPFSLLDLKNEFGSSDQPNTLRTAWERVFGTPSTGGKLSDFDGYGQPEMTNFDAQTSTVLGGYCDVYFTLNIAKNDTFVKIQYKATGTTQPWTDTGSQATFPSDGNWNFKGIQMPSENTNYSFRAIYYNDFNNQSADWKYSSTSTADASNSNQYTTPDIGVVTDQGNTVYVEWGYGDVPSSFSLQSSSDGVSWTTRTLQSSTNWGTFNQPKSGTWTYAGDRIRIRADAEGGINASDWTGAEFI